MDTIDLRSDTVTWPTPEMREAMANAVVGDDIYHEDPTVNQLEADAAELLGKEAGLFVSSGHQGNLASVLTHCARGEEVILGDKAHIFKYEAGSMAGLGSVHPHIVPVQEDGTLKLEDIRHAIRSDNYHFPRTRLICLENTQGTVGGPALDKAYIDSVAAIAQEHGLKLHMDGARIFNAAVATNTPAKDLVEHADSVMFCLSKGLCAPVGSMVVGSADFIAQARRMRKQLGGGMRQVGFLAAAGLISIHKMTHRLAEDHERAQFIAQALEDVPHLCIKSNHTNFVFFDLLESAPVSPEQFTQKLQDTYHVRLSPYPGTERTFRAVTHYWITQEKAEEFVAAVKAVLG